MIETIKYKDRRYPLFQTQGNAAQFIIPFAQQFCKGRGFDIGCHKLEWALPDAQPIDIVLEDEFDAYNLPSVKQDYIFSSHCLEHLEDWVKALEYWITYLKIGGVLFLYLPHYEQEYWRPWNNKKHKHVLTVDVIKDFLEDHGFENIFTGERDLNDSFAIVGQYNG